MPLFAVIANYYYAIWNSLFCSKKRIENICAVFSGETLI